MAPAVKNPLVNAVNKGLIPGQEDLLEKEMATHSSILAWDRGLSMGQSMHTTQQLNNL